MSTNVEYILSLTDNLSPALKKAVQNVYDLDSAVKHATGSLKGMNIPTSKIVSGAKEAQKSISDLEKASEKTNSAISSIGTAMGVTFGLAGIGMFISRMVTAGTVVEDATTGLTTLLKDGVEASQVIKNTMADAAKTPFAFEGLLAANKALISANETAPKAREAVLNLANAISSTGGGNAELERMVVNMQQIKNVGFASALDIKQFAYAGVNIYEVLKQAGIKTGEGIKITYDQINVALKKAREQGGIYANGLENMMNNTSVKLSNVGDSFFQLMNDIFTASKPVIDAVLNGTLAVVESLKSAIGWLREHKALIGEIATVVTALVAAYASYRVIKASVLIYEKLHAAVIAQKILTMTLAGGAITSVTTAEALQTIVIGGLSNAWNILKIAMLNNPMVWVAAIIAGVIYVVIKLSEHFGGFGNLCKAVWNLVKIYVGGMITYFKGLGEVILGIFSAWNDGGALFKKGLKDLEDGTVGTLKRMSAEWNNADAQKVKNVENYYKISEETANKIRALKEQHKISDAAYNASVTNYALSLGKGQKGGMISEEQKQKLLSLIPKVGEKSKIFGANPIGDNTTTGAKSKAEGRQSINIQISYNAPLIKDFNINSTTVQQGINSFKEELSKVLTSVTHDALMVADY